MSSDQFSFLLANITKCFGHDGKRCLTITMFLCYII